MLPALCAFLYGRLLLANPPADVAPAKMSQAITHNRAPISPTELFYSSAFTDLVISVYHLRPKASNELCEITLWINRGICSMT